MREKEEKKKKKLYGDDHLQCTYLPRYVNLTIALSGYPTDLCGGGIAA
jgi:hypothetical protein